MKQRSQSLIMMVGNYNNCASFLLISIVFLFESPKNYHISFSLSPTVVEIGFNPTVYSVNEDSMFVVLNVENRNPAMERDVHVQIATIIGTANSELRTCVYILTYISEKKNHSLHAHIFFGSI